MNNLVKVNISVSTNQASDGSTDTTKILQKTEAVELVRKLRKKDDKDCQMEVLE